MKAPWIKQRLGIAVACSDFHEGVVKTAATAPVGRFFRRQGIDRIGIPFRVAKSPKGHPGKARSDSV